MDVAFPLADLIGANPASILRRLSLVSAGLTTRRIAQLSGVALSSSARTLADLSEIGLVSRRDVGNAALHTLNRQHVLWPAIELMLNAPSAIEHLVRDTVQQMAGPTTTATVYGSFARRVGGRSSDIDIVIAWDDDTSPAQRERSIEEVRERVSTATGNHVDIVDVDSDDLRRMTAADDPLVASWMRDGRTVTGLDLKSRILEARR